MNFSLSDSVTIRNRSYPVRTDFRVILEILIMLSDPDLTEPDKTEALLRMFYIERPADPAAAVEACVSFIRGSRPPSSRARPLVDWEQDFDLMAAPINHILGTECRALPYLHWKTFLSAYLEIGPETLFGRVLHIREKLRSGRRLEKWERLFLKKNRPLVLLRPRLSSREEEILKEWA